MPEIISKDGFKSGYNADVLLIPVNVVNTVAGTDTIRLTVTGNKTLPGLADGETWTVSSDDRKQEVAETIAGKFGGISALSYEVLYDPILMAKLVAHAKTMFTVEIIYDDAEYEDTYVIDVHKCFLTNPGSTSGAANNSAPSMTVTLQPRGGGLLKDCIEVTKVARS